MLLAEREQTKVQMLVQPVNADVTSVGTVRIKWLRRDMANLLKDRVSKLSLITDVINEEKVVLDKFKTECLKAKVELVAPECVVLNEFFTLEFIITSQHSELMDLRTTAESADNFMVCGESESRIKINPGESTKVTLQVMGLRVGFYQLPGIKFIDMKTKQREEIVKSVYSRFVRVLPSQQVQQ